MPKEKTKPNVIVKQKGNQIAQPNKSNVSNKKQVLSEKKHIIIAGCRNEKKTVKILELLESLDPSKHIIVQGGCTGVDTIAKHFATDLGFEVITENAAWDNRESKTYNPKLGYDPKAGPDRNKLMISKYKPKKVFIFHNFIQNSKGSKGMQSLCEKYRVPYEIRGTIEG